MSEVRARTSNWLRDAVKGPVEDFILAELRLRMLWAADEIDRLNAIIKASDHKTYAISESTARDMRVRTRVYGVLAWHVNREHEDLSDRDLALACFREYGKHWGRALIDPSE
jgi:hypothetical protein